MYWIVDVMTKGRTTFEESIERSLEVLMTNSPISLREIAEKSGTDWRAIDRAVNFLITEQDQFAAFEIRVLEGGYGKMVWLKDRLDKMKLPKEMRQWYIEKRFFTESDEKPDTAEIREMFKSEGRTSIEEVVDRLFKVLQIEDNLTIAELARRTGVNRKTVDRALDLILQFQDEIAEGYIYKKDLIVWMPRPALYEMDETTLEYFLKKRYFPDEAKEIPEEQERALLQMA